MKDETGASKFGAIYGRLIDSALVIAVVLAVLQFSGWTYRQAFLKRFSIDPSSLSSSNVAISVEGFTAIVTTFVAWAIASVYLFALAVGAWFFIRWVERRRGNGGTLADQTSILLAQASCFLLALIIVLASGSIAGERLRKTGLPMFAVLKSGPTILSGKRSQACRLRKAMTPCGSLPRPGSGWFERQISG